MPSLSICIKQHNSKCIHSKPDGEYYKINLSMACQCPFPPTSVKEKKIEELFSRGRLIVVLIRKDEDYGKKGCTACVEQSHLL
jgi:hypothetical protein